MDPFRRIRRLVRLTVRYDNTAAGWGKPPPVICQKSFQTAGAKIREGYESFVTIDPLGL